MTAKRCFRLLTQEKERTKPLFPFLLSEFERRNNGSVTFDVFGFEVIQKTAAFTDHFQKSATGMIVVLVLFEVLVQVVDALG